MDGLLYGVVDFLAGFGYIVPNILPVRQLGWAHGARGWYPEALLEFNPKYLYL